jgi:hypothetical protein
LQLHGQSRRNPVSLGLLLEIVRGNQAFVQAKQIAPASREIALAS